MKKEFVFFLFLMSSTFLFAQKSISGVVKNNEGEAVPSASITVEEPGKDAILAYSITNSKGEYKVTFTSSEQNVEVKIKAFNHKAITKTVKNITQTENFTLQTEATEIQEVKLKTKLITKKGDTIAYDLKAFDTKQDRTLADVLKRLPGIEVNKDGSILYQGQALAKFYVNGKDLMEGSYGVINNSLPKDAVQKVEVMENHQPIKILQDKVSSDAAAINIKLKSAITMTGRGEVGTGFGEPWLWNVKLTPMFFGQKSQWVINYKTNNTGETVENEGNMFSFGNRWEGRRVRVSQNDWLNVENASTPSVPENRYLFNNVHFVSANYLINIDKKKEWELKANANYTNNDVERNSYQSVEQISPKDTYISTITNHFYTNKAKGELIFTKNAKKGFFKNITTFSQFWNADRAVTDLKDLILGDKNSNQAIESPTSSFQNSLSTIIPWKEKLVNVMSFISYQNDKQTLEVSPGSYLSSYQNSLPGISSSQTVSQNLRMKTLDANNSANVSFTKKFWTFTPEVGFNFTQNHLTSSLYRDQTNFGEKSNNDLKYTTAVPYTTLRINYKTEKWLVSANLQANFNHIKAEDPNLLRGVSKSINKFTFEPSAFAQLSFASFWKASLNTSVNYNFGEISSAYSGIIMNDPNSFNSMDKNNPIPENVSKSLGARIEYRNPLNNLFFNVGVSDNSMKRNLISNTIFENGGFQKTTYLLKDNTTHSNSFRAEIGKYFPNFKSNISTNYSISDSKSEIQQNGNDINSKNNNQNIGFKFSNAYFSWLSVDYNFNINTTKQTNDNLTLNKIITNTSSGFRNNLSAYIYPKEGHTFGFYWDQQNTKNASKRYNNAFFDVSYQYTWDKKKIDFEIKWMNIANRKVFEDYTLTTNTTRYVRMPIRPSQLMLTVKFNFK